MHPVHSVVVFVLRITFGTSTRVKRLSLYLIIKRLLVYDNNDGYYYDLYSTLQQL